MKTTLKDTRLGTIAVERGLLTRAELDALVTRANEAEKGRSFRSLLGELLVREKYMGAQLLSELLSEQRRRQRDADATGAKAETPARTPATGLDAYLMELRMKGARSLLLATNHPPALRMAEILEPFAEPAVDAERFAKLAAEAFTKAEIDSAPNGMVSKTLERPYGKFRASYAVSEQGPSITFRPVGLDARSDGTLRLTAPLAALADVKRGLVLVTGGRAAVRANVLAQLVATLADKSPRHVIAIERQGVYDHKTKKALIAQREVGEHTASYERALRASLREDPDVIVIGEMREPDAIATALLAAETGHLVIAGVHAADATQALRRMIDAQRVSRRSLVRATLASTLQALAVIDTVRGKTGKQHLVADLVPGTMAVANVIREDRLHQLEATIRSQPGAISRDVRLAELVTQGEVSRVAALECAREARAIPTPERSLKTRG